MNLGGIYQEFGNTAKGKELTLHALKINPNHYGSMEPTRFSSNITEAEKFINLAIAINQMIPKPK